MENTKEKVAGVLERVKRVKTEIKSEVCAKESRIWG